MGSDDSAATDALDPAVARNYRSDEFLVVWAGDDRDGETQIWGRRVNDRGTPLSDEFKVSRSTVTNGVRNPSVVWNSLENEYLVVWEQDSSTAGPVPGGGGGGGGGGLLDDLFGDGDDEGGDEPAPPAGDSEIFARRLTSDGEPLSEAAFPVSKTGDEGEADLTAVQPDVAFNSRNNTYYVVWAGSEEAGDQEIHGQRLESDGDEAGGDDAVISSMGPDGDYDAEAPAISYDSDANQYLVVWSADDDENGMVDGEQEIFGQRLDSSGTETGTRGFRISATGPSGSADHDAVAPDTAYSQVTRRHLVVWSGEEGGDGSFDVHGEFVTEDDDRTGPNDLRLTEQGDQGGAHQPAVSANSDTDEFLLVWSGGGRELGDTEREIFGQRLSTDDEAIGPVFQISRMGSNSDSRYNAATPAVAHSPKEDRYFTFWSGDDPDLVDDEFEIYGRRSVAAGVAPTPQAAPPAATGASAAGADTIPPVMYFAVAPRHFVPGDNATFSVPLSEDATVTVRIDRRPSGIRIARSRFSSRLSCVARTPTNVRRARAQVSRSRTARRARGTRRRRVISSALRRRRCVRTIPQGSLTLPGKFGRNTFPFDGTVAGRRLAPGPYRAIAVAVDNARNRSVSRRRAFTILSG